MPLLPDVVWPGETPACPNHQTPCHLGYAARCTRPAFARICPMVGKRGAKLPHTAAAPLQWPYHDPLDLWHQRQTQNTLSFTIQKIGIEDITWVLHYWCLRWYGHVQPTCIKSITNFPIPGSGKKGGPWKTWSDCVKIDVNKCGSRVGGVHRFSQKWKLRVCKWNFRVCKKPLLMQIPMKMKELGWF